MTNFSVGFRSEDAVEILDLTGELDAHTAPELDAAFRKCRDSGRHKIVVNGEKLRYISSAGLGVILGFIDQVRMDGGDIVISTLSANVFNVFDILGFPLLFRIVSTEAEAVALFDLVPQ